MAKVALLGDLALHFGLLIFYEERVAAWRPADSAVVAEALEKLPMPCEGFAIEGQGVRIDGG
jgi:hypothetical protein